MRDRDSTSGGEAERKGYRESQASSTLSAQSLMQGSNSQNCEILTWVKTKSQMLNWLSHQSAPIICISDLFHLVWCSKGTTMLSQVIQFLSTIWVIYYIYIIIIIIYIFIYIIHTYIHIYNFLPGYLSWRLRLFLYLDYCE